MYQSWSKTEKLLNAKTNQISRYKFKTNLTVARLKNDISTTVDDALAPRVFIKDMRTQTFDKIKTLGTKKTLYEKEEANKEKEISREEEKLADYIDKIATLKETLTEKEPIYKKVIAVKNENDTIHHRVKTKLTVRQGKKNNLLKDLDKFNKDTQALREKFNQLKVNLIFEKL